MRDPVLRLHDDELIVDNFAGGGGASLGIEWALNRSPDIAVNHDPEAIAMHSANHPSTRHFCESVWDVDPKTVCGGRAVGLAWFSPDCKHFSKAKGGKPVEKRIRSLADVVIVWARAVKPRVIVLENVEEFQDWGPLLDNDRPDPAGKGLEFRRWWRELEEAGFRPDMRVLRACDYGAPTTRKRLFIGARSDGRPFEWPEPTHGAGRIPHMAAASCIEWSLPCPSIFERKKALAENTLRRIARGIKKYVLDSGEPFIVRTAHGEVDARGHRRGRGEHAIGDSLPTVCASKDFALVSPSLIVQSWGERKGQAPRILDIHKPLPTIPAGGIKQALVAAFLAKHYGGHETPGSSMAKPIDTITTQDHHHLVKVELRSSDADRDVHEEWLDNQPPEVAAPSRNHAAEVRAFLIKYYGTEQDPRLELPLHTVTTKHRFGLVTVEGEDYAIADIGMRMLAPRELFRAQGFPDTYQIEIGGLSKGAQVRMCGNSVCPPIARAIVSANFAAVETAAHVITASGDSK